MYCIYMVIFRSLEEPFLSLSHTHSFMLSKTTSSMSQTFIKYLETFIKYLETFIKYLLYLSNVSDIIKFLTWIGIINIFSDKNEPHLMRYKNVVLWKLIFIEIIILYFLTIWFVKSGITPEMSQDLGSSQIRNLIPILRA